jgi:hypothetical protein
MEEKKSVSIPVGVRMAADMKEELEQLAREEGRSLSGQVVYGLRLYLKTRAAL